ncbi:hypothetical protein CHUAL_009036 [Chamberlinius hualienensis]
MHVFLRKLTVSYVSHQSIYWERMNLSLLKSLKSLICWCLLLSLSQAVVCSPLHPYQEFDSEMPANNEYEVINGLSLPGSMQSSYYPGLDQLFTPIDVRGKKTITAGKIASWLSALSRERNSQPNDKLKGQRFGITK